jgi:alpha-beta hydrolase superfamily lysophospholipase
MVLPDLPAHGEHRAAFSSVGAREPALALRVAQDMAQRWPGRPLILAGHSLGAGVALRAAVAAERAGLPVAGVIAFAPYRTLRSPIPARLALKGLPRFPLAEVAVLALRALRCMDQPLENDARALRAPLLVMAGDHDPISPAADARALASAAPRATLVELPFVRHDDLREGDPQRHDRALAEFLAAITARPAAAGARA